MQNKIEYVKTNSIKGASFQPDGRTEEWRISKLKKNIEAAGGILVPLLVKDGHLVDGHRRLAVAKQLGFSTVPVVHINGTMSGGQAFVNVNSGNKHLSAADAMQSVAKGLDPELLPQPARSNINNIIRLVGKTGLKRLVEHRRSPNIYHEARRVSAYCGKDDDAFRAKVMTWMDENDSQFTAKLAMDNHCPVSTLLRVINSNKTLRPQTVWE